MKELGSLLKKYWGYDAFRPLQEEIIGSVLAGHDTLALLPTGGGKSMCYQLPAVASEGIAIVVSPLIALMKDQVQQLSQRKIKAACLVSGMSFKEQDIVLNNSLYGGVKLLYVSPERLKSKSFLGHLAQMKVSFFAVDEAHCISQWGYDFRPPYLEIAAIRNYHPGAPVLALTATATPRVVKDIQLRLAFRDGRLFQSSFARKNLAYMVFEESNKMWRLQNIINHVGGSGIVYVRNRRRTQEVANWLNAHGVAASFYHAGLPARERDAKQAEWMQDSSRVMVATNAFGMGIDKNNVRYVVHLDLPSSPEAYFQEAGRAGRDGQQAYAVILYNHTDVEFLNALLEQEFPPLQYIQNAYRAICNFYQIPTGSGLGLSVDFDIEQLCRTYGFQPAEFFAATRILEREGLIAIPERQDLQSRLHILVSNEEFYRFQVGHKKYDPLFQQLLRNYGGLFTDYVTISEKRLSRATYLPEETIEKMLLQLDAFKLVEYKRHTNAPQLIFTAPRVDDKGLYISNANYRDLKEVARHRIEVMCGYLKDEVDCRSGYLLNYFGEHDAEPCQQCDRCIAHRKMEAFDEAEMTQQIREQLRQQPLTLLDLVARLSSRQKQMYPQFSQQVESLVRRLVDEREVSLNADLQLYI